MEGRCVKNGNSFAVNLVGGWSHSREGCGWPEEANIPYLRRDPIIRRIVLAHWCEVLIYDRALDNNKART